MSDTKKVLTKARQLIARPYGWGRGANSKPQPRVKGGKAYCADGAVLAAAALINPNVRSVGRSHHLVAPALEALRRECGRPETYLFNDSARDKREVLRLFDRAIEAVSLSTDGGEDK